MKPTWFNLSTNYIKVKLPYIYHIYFTLKWIKSTTWFTSQIYHAQKLITINLFFVVRLHLKTNEFFLKATFMVEVPKKGKRAIYCK
jgi:hypothetical protein